MSIFQKIVLRGLKKNRSRTIVTVIGVALAALLLTVITTFAVSLQSYMIRGAVEKYGDWAVQIFATDAEQATAQQDNSEVKKVTVCDEIGYAKLEGCENPDKPYAYVMGFDETSYETLPVHLISGRLPQTEAEILIPSHVMTNGGMEYSVGDTITLSVGTRMSEGRVLDQNSSFLQDGEHLTDTVKKTYRVVGTCQRPSFEAQSAPGYTFITASGSGTKSCPKSLFVSLKNPGQTQQYVGDLDTEMTYALNDNVLRFYGASGDQMFNTLLYTVAGVLIALIMLASVFLIYNSFHMSLNERMQQYGVLMSVGATQRQLRHAVLFEGICVGCIGIPIGMVIGIPGVKLILYLTEQNFSNILYADVPLKLTLSVPALLLTVMISLITILISAWIPAKKAMHTPIMECICQSNEVQVSGKVVSVSPWVEQRMGLEGSLALKNFKRNRRRYRSVILSLTLSVVLFVSASAFSNDLKSISGGQGDVSAYDVALNLPNVDAHQREIMQQNQNMIFVVNLFAGVFIVMMSLIAIANVFNTISTNIKMRRRELAMLRSVGMSDGSFSKMMRMECWFYGLRTMLFGIPLSILLSVLIWFELDAGGGELKYQFPLQSLCISLGSVLLIIFITMFYATAKLRKENIIDALRDDNM